MVAVLLQIYGQIIPPRQPSFVSIQSTVRKPFYPQFVYFFTPFFTAVYTVYTVKRLVLKTIYVLNREILQFLGLKSEA